MARKHQLRDQRAGTVINVTSKRQESEIVQALVQVADHLHAAYAGISLVHQKQWHLRDIAGELRHTYPDTGFYHRFDSSSIRPDSGILCVEGQPDDPLTHPMFGKLNSTHLHNEEGGEFNRGSFYFRPDPWTVDQMYEVMKDIADRSVLYYFSKYRVERFKHP